MKKVLCILLSLITVLSFSSCLSSGADSEKAIVINKVSEKVLSDWMNILDIKGATYSGNIWAAEYIKAYCENPDLPQYKNALIAVDVLGSLSEENELRSKILFRLTDGDVETAMDADIDLLDVRGAVLELDADISAEKEERAALRRDILTYSFTEKGMEYLEAVAALKTAEAEIYYEYYRIMTNSVMLSLGIEEYPALLVARSHGILTEDSVFMKKQKDVKEALADCSERLAAQENKYKGICTLHEELEKMLTDAASAEDFASLAGMASDLFGAYNALPLPLWDEVDIFAYYSDENLAQSDALVEVGDEIEKTSADYSVTVKNVTKEIFVAYLASLQNMGIKYIIESGSLEGDDTLSIFAKAGNDTVSFYLENGKLSIYIDSDRSFVCPDWYLSCING